jgi:2-polyprenyl-3-methyl-5-hydroxy-6-metoxy-1,4-benzoquinol methylase
MSRFLERLLSTAGIGRKNFSGNLFDRMRGLEFLLERSAGRTVLDIGCNEGLIAYEFARHGARLVHGLERDGQRVRFARRLFRDVPIESRFERANVALSGAAFDERYDWLLPSYDIVLFLGVYHHLARQMPQAELQTLVERLAQKATLWFADRGSRLHEYEAIVLAGGLRRVHESPAIKGHGGLLHVYERRPADPAPRA